MIDQFHDSLVVNHSNLVVAVEVPIDLSQLFDLRTRHQEFLDSAAVADEDGMSSWAFVAADNDR